MANIRHLLIRHLLINDTRPCDLAPCRHHVTSVRLQLFGSNRSWPTHPPLFPSRPSDAPPSIFYQLPISVLALPMTSPLLDLINESLFRHRDRIPVRDSHHFWSHRSQFLRNRPPVRPTSLTDLCVGMFSLLLSDFWCWSCFLHRYNFLLDRTLIYL